MINVKILKCVECEYNDYNITYGKCNNCHNGSKFKEKYYWIKKSDNAESEHQDNENI